jgi:CheY-like chemotaxis protein
MSTSSASSRPVILVVDDDLHMRDLFELLLTGEGYGVLTASDGVEALRLAERRKPALILADVVMPRLDGVGFAQSYHERGGTAPIVLVTAVTGTAAEAAVAASGAAAYLRKPFDVDRLLEIIARLAMP